MNGGNHLAIGSGSAFLVLWGLQSVGVPMAPITIGSGALVAGLGALMPDIDHPSSTASRGLPNKLLNEGANVLVPMVVMGGLLVYFGGRTVGAQLLSAFAPVLKLGAALVGAALAFFCLAFIARMTTGHRGVTHSLVLAFGAAVAVALTCVALGVPWWYGAFFGWGWLTHLAADAPSRTGLPSLFWPFDTTR